MARVFGAMSFGFPARLTLYIFTNMVLSALHSIYMNKFNKKKEPGDRGAAQEEPGPRHRGERSLDRRGELEQERQERERLHP